MYNSNINKLNKAKSNNNNNSLITVALSHTPVEDGIGRAHRLPPTSDGQGEGPSHSVEGQQIIHGVPDHRTADRGHHEMA